MSEIDALLAGARGLRRRAAAICSCGAPLLIGARYCPSCGTSLVRRGVARPGRARRRDAACPRCGAALAPTQEYCLELRPAPAGQRPLRRRTRGAPPAGAPVLGLAAVALAGAVARRLSRATRPPARTRRDRDRGERHRRGARGDARRKALADWPAGATAGRSCSSPCPRCRDAQAAVASPGRRVLAACRTSACSTRRSYASLHPGYWLVFSGRYATEPEATSSLRRRTRRSRSRRGCTREPAETVALLKTIVPSL